MKNILFFLKPKAMCAFLQDDYTIRQALEKMESAGYAALPILNKRGEYRGSLSEGDLLWAMKNICYMDMRQAEAHRKTERLCSGPCHHQYARLGGTGKQPEFCSCGRRQGYFHWYRNQKLDYPVLQPTAVPG